MRFLKYFFVVTNQGRFFVRFYAYFIKNAPYLPLIVVNGFVNVLAVKKTDIAINKLLEGKRGDIVVRNLTKDLYLITVSIASVKRNHDAAVVESVEIVGVVILLALNLKGHSQNSRLSESDFLLLLGQSIEVSGKKKTFIYRIEVPKFW